MKPLKKFTTSFAILFILVQLFCVRTSFAGNEAATIENPTSCKVCGMDRNVYVRSRMLIVYTDGTTVGLCSFHCAAEEMRGNKEKQVKSITVADYATTKLIDAKTATWVIGGSKPGVMTYLPEWAFAEEQEAQAFVKEYGGKVSTFDEAQKAAEDDVAKAGAMNHDHQGHMGHDMNHMDMGPARPNAVQPSLQRSHILYPPSGHVDGQLLIHAYGHDGVARWDK